MVPAEITEIPSEKLEKVMEGYTYEGKFLVPNLKPLKQIALKYDLEDQLNRERRARGSSVMIGKAGEYYYLVLSKEKSEEPLVVKTD